MKAKDLINLLVEKIIREGDDVDVKIYDAYCGEYREIDRVAPKEFDEFVIELSKDVDV